MSYCPVSSMLINNPIFLLHLDSICIEALSITMTKRTLERAEDNLESLTESVSE